MEQDNVKMNSKNRNHYWLLIIALMMFALPLCIKNIYTIHIFIIIIFYAFLASAWNILCGFVGELSLGHSALLGIGGYTSTLLFINYNISPWIGIFFGAVAAIIAAVIIGVPSFRLRGPYFALTTIAFAEFLRIYIENHEIGPFGIPLKGAMGLLVPLHGNAPGLFEFSNKIYYYYIILLALFASTLITYIITKKRLGYYLVAIRSNPDAAESLGINIMKYKLTAIIISAAVISFGGTFYAQYFRYIGPTRTFGVALAVEIAVIGIIGGQGTVLGPLFGAFLVIPISEFLMSRFGGNLPGLHLFVYGLVLMLVILFMPKGIHDPFVNLLNKVEENFLDLFRPKKNNNKI